MSLYAMCMSLYAVACHCMLYFIVQNIAVTYAGMVFGGDYVYSATNFVGINVRSVHDNSILQYIILAKAIY